MTPVTERISILALENNTSPEEVVAEAFGELDLLRSALYFYGQVMNYIVQKYGEVEVRDDGGEVARDAVKLIDRLESEYYTKPLEVA